MSVPAAYSWLLIASIALTIVLWARRVPRDRRLWFIYLAALAGAFLGAKIVYLLCEGWLHFGAPDVWWHLAAGKSILGALLGGYGGVELAKSVVGYPGVTGDWFAAITPGAIIIGRIGCLLQGCCLGKTCSSHWFCIADATGVSRWPAVPVEIAFNLLALGAFTILGRKHLLPGQHFHLYLISYGLFRFAHEMVRDTPRLFGAFTGYQLAALGVFALGAIRFRQRALSSRSI